MWSVKAIAPPSNPALISVINTQRGRKCFTKMTPSSWNWCRSGWSRETSSRTQQGSRARCGWAPAGPTPGWEVLQGAEQRGEEKRRENQSGDPRTGSCWGPTPLLPEDKWRGINYIPSATELMYRRTPGAPPLTGTLSPCRFQEAWAQILSFQQGLLKTLPF